MCPISQHQSPYIYNTFQDGLNYDSYVELVPVISKSEYVDAMNMRHSSTNRAKDALEKINGEQLIYPLIDNRCIGGSGLPLPTSYRCVGGDSCNGYLFEIWADTTGVNPPLVRINGKIVLQSAKFLADAFHYFNTHTDQSVLGGIVFATDGENPPYDFKIADLLQNSGIEFSTGQMNTSKYPCTQKYFTGFDISFISQSIVAPADHPIFVELGIAGDVATGAGLNLLPSAIYSGWGAGGLAVGNYLYSISYVNITGDQTNWSTPTPCIPVVGNLSNQASPYPYTKTYGLATGTVSAYGIHIRFRVTNLNNYQYIQVLRLAYNNGYAPNTTNTFDIIARVAITDGQVGIIDFFDAGATPIATLTNLDVAENLSIIDKANSNRFVNLRKYLGGITYASKDINADIIFTDAGGTPCYPQMVGLGQIGHKEPYNAVYYKHYQNGEQYPFAIQPFDNTFSPFFPKSVPIPTTNAAYPNAFQFPNRRDPQQIITNVIGTGSTTAALTNPINSTGKCYEVWDLANGVYKTDLTTVHSVSPQEPYKPFRPVLDSDPSLSATNGAVDWNCVINDQTSNGNVFGTFVDYSPQMFAPDYYAMGLAIKGVSFPDTVAGFSVVRGERANRIVAQGISFYNITSSGILTGTTKALNSFYFYSPDFESGLADPQAIIDGFGSGIYAVEFVSPLGFGSELYSFYNVDGSGAASMIDMISYARVLYESGVYQAGSGYGSINNDPSNGGDTPSTNGVSGYTSYGYWRTLYDGTSGTSIFSSGKFGNNTFTITGMTSQVTSSGQSTRYLITIGSNLYKNANVSYTDAFTSTSARNFHEPVYVVNIINTAATIPNQNINSYFDTGTYIKTKSIIGIGTGSSSQSYNLVDERVGDCSQLNSTLTAPTNRYIYIQDPVTQNISQWIDVTLFNDAQKHTVFTQIPSLYGGAYTVTSSQVGGSPLNQLYTVNFNVNTLVTATHPTDTPTPVPTTGATIYVYYDNTEPIVGFGGDNLIGESTFALVDDVSPNGGGSATDGSSYFFPVPYSQWHLNSNIHLYADTTEQNFFTVLNQYVRQHVIMFTAEAKTCLPYDFTAPPTDYIDRMFPNVNYIMKPVKWNTGNPASDYVWTTGTPNYSTDYAEMISGTAFTGQIQVGGFKFKQSDTSTLIDYSHEANQFVYFSKPQVGFVEQNYYPTRIIWSDQKIINSQNIPGLQTFPPLNFFDISDDTGAINFLWDAQTGKYGNNIYAFTDSGICLTFTNQFEMTAGSDGQLTTLTPTSGEQGILQEQWMSKIIGMPFRMMRTKGEFNNNLFWTNNNSVYKFSGTEPIDIGRQNYYSRIYVDILSNQDGMNGYGLAGVIDPVHKEYLTTIKQYSLNINNEPLYLAGITNEYSYYNVSFINGFVAQINVDLAMGSIVYVTNSWTGDFQLADYITQLPFFVLPKGQTAQVTFNGDGNYDVVSVNSAYSYAIFTTTATLQSLVYDGTTTSISGVYTNLTELLNLLINNYSFGGTVAWTINQNYIIGTTTHVLGVMTVYNGIFTEPITPNNELQLPFEAITFSYVDYTIVPQTASQNEVVKASWNGAYIYDYDKMVAVGNQLYGIKSGGTYLLNQTNNFTFNGEPITGSVLQAFSADGADSDKAKEFIRTRVNSNNSPTEINFYYNLEQYRASNIQSQVYSNFVQRYGTECYVPRRITLSNQRMQSSFFVYNVENSNAESFIVSSIGVQYKVLK